MSLVDRTNEEILLSLHRAGPDGALLNVDLDADSSFDPSHWIHICWTDIDHDSDRIKLAWHEAGLLHDRLGLILGRSGTTVSA